MRLLHVGIVLCLLTAAFADTVTLKSGRVVRGTYLGGSARQVRMEVGDEIQSVDVTEIDRIEFGGPAGPLADARPAPPPRETNDRPVLRRPEENVMRPEPAPAPARESAR